MVHVRVRQHWASSQYRRKKTASTYPPGGSTLVIPRRSYKKVVIFILIPPENMHATIGLVFRDNLFTINGRNPPPLKS